MHPVYIAIVLRKEHGIGEGLETKKGFSYLLPSVNNLILKRDNIVFPNDYS